MADTVAFLAATEAAADHCLAQSAGSAPRIAGQPEDTNGTERRQAIRSAAQPARTCSQCRLIRAAAEEVRKLARDDLYRGRPSSQNADLGFTPLLHRFSTHNANRRGDGFQQLALVLNPCRGRGAMP